MFLKAWVILFAVFGSTLAQNSRARQRQNPRVFFDDEDPPAFSHPREIDEFDSLDIGPVNKKPLPNKAARGRLPVAREDDEEVTVKPVVQTIRRYSAENEDGTFTFGYENADGTYKEETRGADCVVRGKFGYVDPDGVKREFAYETGNPCVPGEERADDAEEEMRDFRPANPQRRPVKGTTPRPASEKRPSPSQRPVATATASTTTTPTPIDDDDETAFVPAAVPRSRPQSRPVFGNDDGEAIEPEDVLNMKANAALNTLRHRKQDPVEQQSEQQHQQQPKQQQRLPTPVRSAAPRRPTESAFHFDDEFERLTNTTPPKANPVQTNDQESKRNRQIRRRPVRPSQRALFIEDN